MDEKTQKISFVILTAIGLIPVLILCFISIKSSDFGLPFNGISSISWEFQLIRFFSDGEAFMQLWEIILPLATTLLSVKYLSQLRSWQQLCLFLLFLSGYLALAYIQFLVNDPTGAKMLENASLKLNQISELKETLRSLSQYCVTILVLMLGITSIETADK